MCYFYCFWQETAVDFKSLRAKFQACSQLKDRPIVLDKPKRFPPTAGRAILSPTFSVEDKNPAIPSLNLRDDQKVLSGKRTDSVPSCFFGPDTNGIGSGVARRSVKDRQFPLVLPAPPSLSSNNPEEEAISSAKLVTSPIKCKKKAMPTPFKPAKFPKSIKEILENAEHSESSKPSQNGFSPHKGGSNPGSPCPSPDQPSTPSPTSEDPYNGGGIPHVLSTLERAKKKFSPKNLLVYTRPKSFYSTKGQPESPPPPVKYENLQDDVESSSGSRPSSSPNFNYQNLPQTNGITHSKLTKCSCISGQELA